MPAPTLPRWLLWRKTCQKILEPTPFYGLLLYSPRQVSQFITTPTDLWPGDISKGASLIKGRFILEPQVVSFEQLWDPEMIEGNQFAYLHNFAWLRNLRAVGDNTARRLARELIINWIAGNHHWRSLSWRADILGYRLANWLSLYDFFGASADEKFHAYFFKSLLRQAKHLERIVPPIEDAYTKHCALKGLIFVNLTLPSKTSLVSHYLNDLVAAAQQAVSPPHVTSTLQPLRQLQILKDLIDTRGLLLNTPYAAPVGLQETIAKITPLMRLLRHGDGGLAFCEGNASQASPAEVDMALSLSDVKGRLASPLALQGFARLQIKNIVLLINLRDSFAPLTAKSVAPLNFEWSVGKERIIVQSDLALDNSNLKTEATINYQLHHHEGHQLIDTTWQQGPLTYNRKLYLAPSNNDFRGEETIQYPTPPALITRRFLFHPHINIVILRGGQGAIIKLRNGQNWRFFIKGTVELSSENVFIEGPFYSDTSALIFHIPITDQIPHTLKWAWRIV